MTYRPYPIGANYTAYNYSSAWSDESLRRMEEDNVEWVAITTWWYQENLTSTEIYPHLGFTPANESLKHAIQTAHNLSMKVLLKPMIDPEHWQSEWRGNIASSAEWFASYEKFITQQAQLANETGVELLSIGCEFQATEADSSSWRQIISDIRTQYKGNLTYAATKDSYQDISWWDALDYVGIDAYFELTNKTDPTLEELTQAWNNTANNIQLWHDSKMDKPILFTEIGYRSWNGTNRKPWYWAPSSEVDFQEQFDCYLAAFLTLKERSWFNGFYWWMWESNPNAGGLNDTDFTPQNKPVEYLIRSWYSLALVPEFPAILILPLIAALTAVAVILTRRPQKTGSSAVTGKNRGRSLQSSFLLSL